MKLIKRKDKESITDDSIYMGFITKKLAKLHKKLSSYKSRKPNKWNSIKIEQLEEEIASMVFLFDLYSYRAASQKGLTHDCDKEHI